MNIKRIDCKVGQTAVSMYIFTIRYSAKPWIVGKQVRSNIETLECWNIGTLERLRKHSILPISVGRNLLSDKQTDKEINEQITA